MTARLTVKDKGYKALIKRLSYPPVSLTVGIHDEDNEVYDRGTGMEATTAMIGTFHEYGTVDMPPRPWLTPVVEAGWERYLTSVSLVEQAFVMGKLSAAERKMKLGVVGEKIVSDIIKHIKKQDFEPLAESTIMARKNEGSITILIDSGQFWQSIGYEIKDSK